LQPCEFELHIQGMPTSVIPLANLIKIYFAEVKYQIFKHLILHSFSLKLSQKKW